MPSPAWLPGGTEYCFVRSARAKMARNWGEPTVVDPKRLNVGYGTGEQVVPRRLEGP